VGLLLTSLKADKNVTATKSNLYRIRGGTANLNKRIIGRPERPKIPKDNTTVDLYQGFFASFLNLSVCL
jgi:hypothetical protein